MPQEPYGLSSHWACDLIDISLASAGGCFRRTRRAPASAPRSEPVGVAPAADVRDGAGLSAWKRRTAVSSSVSGAEGTPGSPVEWGAVRCDALPADPLWGPAMKVGVPRSAASWRGCRPAGLCQGRAAPSAGAGRHSASSSPLALAAQGLTRSCSRPVSHPVQDQRG